MAMTYEQLSKPTVRSFSREDRKYAYEAISKAKEQKPMQYVRADSQKKLEEIMRRENAK